MTRLHMNTQRRAILRVLLGAERHMTTRQITDQLDLAYDVVSRALKRFEDKEWVIAKDGGAIRPGYIRSFMINPDARLSIEVVLEGWSFEARPGGST